MYGYAPFAPAVANPYGGPMQPYGAYTVFGADAPAEKTLGQKTNEFLNAEAIKGVPNKYPLAIALAAGLGYWGWHAGWFG